MRTRLSASRDDCEGVGISDYGAVRRERPLFASGPWPISGAVCSETLGLHVCWDHGRLRLFDSMTESYLLSHQEEVEARRDAEAEIRRLRAHLEELNEGR